MGPELETVCETDRCAGSMVIPYHIQHPKVHEFNDEQNLLYVLLIIDLILRINNLQLGIIPACLKNKTWLNSSLSKVLWLMLTAHSTVKDFNCF